MQSIEIKNIRNGRVGGCGIRIFKDNEVCLVSQEDLQNSCTVLVLESGLYLKGSWGMDSAQYESRPLLPSVDAAIDAGFKGYVFSVPFESWKALDIYDLESLFQSGQLSPYYNMNPDETVKVKQIIELIYLSLGSDQGCSNELTYLCWAFMATISGFYVNNAMSVSLSSNMNSIARNFVKLVNEHCLQEKKLSFYASELGIAPKYLSSVVTKATGKNAKRWISDCTIKKSKELLITTSYPIEKISQLMGFRTSSDFCKLFRSHSGMSPLYFRRFVLSTQLGNYQSRSC